MSVDEWARRDAKRIYGQGSPDGEVPIEMRGYASAREQGIVHAFSALLSDEAIAAGLWHLPSVTSENNFRDALQAAIDAVTEGDTSGR